MQYQRPVLVQQQKLKLSPQFIQTIRVMTLSLPELRFHIREELERNPALEIIEDPSQISLEREVARDPGRPDLFENTSDPGRLKNYDSDRSDRNRQMLEGALSTSESLHEHLMWQLRLQVLNETEFSTGEALVGNLDENGFHIEPPGSFLTKVSSKTIEKMIQMIQGFEPVGTCVKDFTESLQVQVSIDPAAPLHMHTLIRDHLHLAEKGRLQDVAKQLGISAEDAEEHLAYLKTLTPWPGRYYSNSEVVYIIPDITVLRKNNDFVFMLNDEEIPRLGITGRYKQMFDDNWSGSMNDKDAVSFIKKSLRDAQWFIQTIEQRNQTLMRFAQGLLEFQRPFFEHGPKRLAPLTLDTMAKAISVHKSTVSRIANAKYIQTKWGLFPLRYFFSNSITGSGASGSPFSKTGVKAMIKEIIDQNSGDKRPSDQKICDRLNLKGISIARRTVAKYRKELEESST